MIHKPPALDDDWKGESKLRNIKPDDYRRKVGQTLNDICQDPDCPTVLSRDNMGGFCQKHRKPHGARKRETE